MKTAFITGFWGSSDPAWWRGRMPEHRIEPHIRRWLNKTVPEAQRSCELMLKLGTRVYAYGKEAAEAVAPLPVTMMSTAEFGGHWRLKLDIIRKALDDFDAVTWVDMDIRMLVDELPSDFWERMHDKGPCQALITQWHRRKCHYWRSDKENPRSMPSGAYIYCRSTSIIDTAIQWLEDQKRVRPHDAPFLDDQQAIAFAIDELNGGWKGLDYYNEHHNPPWYTLRTEIFPCETPIFTAS